jgi:mannose-6-phosphate isomerase-like protein (cupin superfamily)
VQIDGEQTGEAYNLVELSARSGDMPPLHVHHRDDETFYVLEGEMTLFLGDRLIAVSHGQAALAPAGRASHLPRRVRTGPVAGDQQPRRV